MENYNAEEDVVKEYDSKLMKRLISFARPYFKQLSLVILLMLIITVLDLSRPYLVKNAIDNYIHGYKAPFTLYTSSTEGSVKIDNGYVLRGNFEGGLRVSIVNSGDSYYLVYGSIDHNSSFNLKNDTITQGKNSFKLYKLTKSEIKALRGRDVSGIIRTTLYMLLITISIFILNYAQVYLLNYTGQKIVLDIRKKLFKHVEGLSLSFFDKNPVGRLVTRVTNDVETLNEMYTGVIVSLFKDFFLLTGIIIAMFILNPKLALIILAVIPLLVASALVFKKYDRDAYRDVRVKLAAINSSLSENISGMKTVQIFNKEEKKFNEFNKINQSYLDATLKQITVYAVFRPTIDLISSLSLAAVIWFGGGAVLKNALPFGVLFAFISYLQQFFNPINDLTEKYDILQSAMASSERIFMLMDTDEKIKNTDTPVSVDKIEGRIEFRNVWFAYKDEEWVLRDVSFKICPGERVAFVGATGAGKTSIISLLSRFYDIQRGEILIDGINIKDMDLDALRGNIATVLQDVFLFTGDIKGNIRLNNSNISDEAIIKASKYVNAHNFIDKLPEKYNSYVNERGSTFSQGERQLIAFARAIAFNPPILVLDEATSNIDTETESLIQDALEKITKDRTTIVVAHRLSTIKKADKIIVLHKGKLREMGSHEELLTKKGLYYNLYELQYKD